jgi:ribosomal protein L24E
MSQKEKTYIKIISFCGKIIHSSNGKTYVISKVLADGIRVINID